MPARPLGDPVLRQQLADSGPRPASPSPAARSRTRARSSSRVRVEQHPGSPTSTIADRRDVAHQQRAQAAGRAGRPGREDLRAQRGGDERRVAGRTGDRRIDDIGRRSAAPAAAGDSSPPASPAGARQLADGLRPHQRHVGREQEEPGDAGVQRLHPGADRREHAVVEVRGWRRRRAPARVATGATSSPRCPVTTTTSSTPAPKNPPIAHSSSVRPSTSTSGLNAPMREERPAARTMAASRSTVRRPRRTAPGRSRRRCSRRARPASPRRWTRPMGEWIRAMAVVARSPHRAAPSSMRARLERLAMRPT